MLVSAATSALVDHVITSLRRNRREGAMTVRDANSRNVPLKLWHRVWPLVGLIAAAVVNLAWIAFLGFVLTKIL
jgi:hypothetical protein